MKEVLVETERKGILNVFSKLTASDFPIRFELKIAKEKVLDGDEFRRTLLIEKCYKMYYLSLLLPIFL